MIDLIKAIRSPQREVSLLQRFESNPKYNVEKIEEGAIIECDESFIAISNEQWRPEEIVNNESLFKELQDRVALKKEVAGDG